MKERGPDLPVYFGNRNWHPMLTDTIAKMKSDGIERALAVVTSAFSCYSGCRQYRENIYAACEAAGPGAPVVDKMRVYYNHPGFVKPMAANVRSAIEKFPQEHQSDVHLVFTAHSIPQGMAENSRYEWQLLESSRLVVEELGTDNWKLVYQSRSGPPAMPWLEPDVCDYIQSIHDEKVTNNIVIIPIGFISDHMEVMFDLDTEARELCESLGMRMERASTVGTAPDFVEALRLMIAERMTDAPDRLALGAHGPSHDVCPEDCCLPGRRPAARPGT